MLVLSRRPIRFSAETLAEKLARLPEHDLLASEIRRYGVEKLAGKLDRPRLAWDGPLRITDDHPLVEYPALADRLLGERGAPFGRAR
jgi:hypothetical protein